MATADLLTLAEAKSALNETSTTHDTELAIVITAVSRRIVDLCGNVVEVTYTDEAYDGGDNYLDLRHAPRSDLATTTVSAVKEYDSAGELTTLTAETATTKPDDAYLVVTEAGTIYRRSSGADARFLRGRRNILATYIGGRAASTAAVPPIFKEATRQWLRLMWVPSQAAGGAVFGAAGLGETVTTLSVPNVVRGILGDEVMVSVA